MPKVLAPSISICIPTFDRLAFLKEAVGSARTQSHEDLEVLIGDDGSSETLKAWCLSQAADDPRVRYLHTPRRLGLAGNWNFLSNAARAPFVSLIGDDDRLLPAFVARLLPLGVDGADVAFSNHYLIDGHGRRLEAESPAVTLQYGRANLRPGFLDDPVAVVWNNAAPMSGSIERTEQVRRLLFKEDMNTPELELFARLASDGGRFAFTAEYLSEYRVHTGSETAVGLKVDRLAQYLEDIAVPPHVEARKQLLLGAMMSAGVDIRLARGDVAGARMLRASPYYRASLGPRSVVQRLLLALPDRAASTAHALLRRGMRALRAIHQPHSGAH
jgi:glycosyltransferase involved in cell wall biosynthesis